MTVSSAVSNVQYAGNGVTKTFAAPFYFLLNSDIAVQISDASGNITDLVYGTNYSVTGAGNAGGGSVTLNVAYATGYTILVYRNPPVTQETVYYENGKFPAKSHEKALDKLTMLIQQVLWGFDTLVLKKPSFLAKYYDGKANRIANLADPVNTQDATTKGYVDGVDGNLQAQITANNQHTLRVPEEFVPTLPPIEQRAGSVLGWNDSGIPVSVFSYTATADLSLKLASNTVPGISLVGVNVYPGAQSSAPYLKTVSDIMNGGPAVDSRFLRKDKISAIRAGLNDYDATNDLLDQFNAGSQNIQMGRGVFNHSVMLEVPRGARLSGVNSGLYMAEGRGILEEQNLGLLTTFQATHKGVDSIAMRAGRHSVITDICLRPYMYDTCLYYDAEYGASARLAGTTDPSDVNCDHGIHMLISAKCDRVLAHSFKQHGFIPGKTSRLSECYAYMNGGYGYYPRGETLYDNASDGEFIGCTAMFNITGGAWMRSNFWTTLGGRFEWNAGEGYVSGGEGKCVGATFDRNGKAGFRFQSGQWGFILVAPYFCRNGALGDGTKGRWGFSIPGHPSYKEIPVNESTQIMVDFQHAGVIRGARFRAGQDDSVSGVQSPAYILSSLSSSGSSPISGLSFDEFEGGFGSSVNGYVPSYAGSTGLPVGGTDATLIANYRGGLLNVRNGASTKAITSRNSTTAQVSSLSIPVPYRYSGVITVYAGKSTTSPALCQLLVSCNPAGGSRAVTKTVLQTGADTTNAGYISSSSYVAGTDSIADVLTVNFIDTVFVNYAIGHSGVSS